MHKIHKSAKKYISIITTRDIQLHLERMGTIQNLTVVYVYLFNEDVL